MTNIYTTSSYKCVLEVVDTVKDKSDSIQFLVLCQCQSWIFGAYCPQCPLPSYAYARRSRPSVPHGSDFLKLNLLFSSILIYRVAIAAAYNDSVSRFIPS